MEKWKTVRLGDVLIESKVESSRPNIEKRIRVLLNAKGVVQRPIKKETKGATKYFTRKKGQFIYGKQNIHKGAFGIIPNELDSFESTSDLPAFDVDKSCLPLWIDYYLKQRISRIKHSIAAYRKAERNNISLQKYRNRRY